MDDQTPIIDEDNNQQKEEDVMDGRAERVHHIPVQDSVESTDLPEIRVYKRRWYILGLFGLLACHQCIVWNTFGPIESAVQYAYHWSNAEAPMLANWGCIMFVITSIPLTKLAEALWLLEPLFGVVIFSSKMIYFSGSGIPILFYETIVESGIIYISISCHICAIFNGISGVTIMAAPPLISSKWFPPNERTTATSINQAFNMLGNGLAMLVGPGLVNIPKDCTNSTHLSPDCPEVADIERDIDNYMVIQAGVAMSLFLLFLLYFPSAPAHPPAPTAAIERMEFWTGARQIFRNRTALLVCFSYSLGGILGSWLSVMVNNFRPLGIEDQDIGMIGLIAVLGQCALATIVGFTIDRIKHKMKITLVVLISLATAGFVWLTLICTGSAPVTIWRQYDAVYLSVILSSSISFSCIPIFFEMSVEVTYPVHESIVGGFLTTFYNLVAIIFLLLFFIPNVGYTWINYTLVAATALTLPAMLLTQETYNRSNVDEAVMSPNY